MIRGHELAMLLRGAYLTLHRQAQQLFAPFGVTADQFVLLTLLAKQDDVIQQDLVRRSFSDPNTVRAILVLLEKQKLVSRRAYEHDGRARIVHLTSKGRKLHRILMRQSCAFHQAVAACLPADESNAVAGFLAGVRGNMNAGNACGKATPLAKRRNGT
jgi:MarR family transcriptional regulator, organic hydroperoxide resistance regulator